VVIPDIGAAGADQTITMTGTQTVNSITTRENVTLNGGSFRLTGNLAVDGGATFALGGASLQFMSPSAATNQQVTTTGGGTITSTGGGISQAGVAGSVSHTVTFGPWVTVVGGGVICQSGESWANSGTWSAPAGKQFSMSGNGTFTNLPGGVWETTGGTFSIGTIGTFPTRWSNAGTIRVTAGLVYLAGAFTVADLGTLSRTGGTVSVNGRLSNSVVSLDDTTGSWTVDPGGVLDNCTVNTSGSARLVFNGGSVVGDLTLNGSVTVTGGLYFSNNFGAGPNTQELRTTSAAHVYLTST